MTEHFPRSAVVKGRGKVRVLSYEGDGMFRVLGPDDQVIRVHRDRMMFKSRKK